MAVVAGAGVMFTGLLTTSGAATASTLAAPPTGGTFTYALSGIPNALDPDLDYIRYESDAPEMLAIYGALAYANPHTGSSVPSFLKSIKSSNDYKTWTLTLHPNLKFSDGTPFNAAAIAFNIARGANKNSGDGYQVVLAKLHTTVVNDTTLKITEAQPDTALPEELTQDFPFVASPTAVKKEGQSFGVHPVGAGPFKVSSFVQNSTIKLTKNPYYSSFAKGQPYMDGVVFQDLSNSQTQVINAVGANTAQMTWVQGNTQVKQARGVGAKVNVYEAGGGEWLLFNLSKPPFNNLLAREAVYYGLNHQALADSWTPGLPAMSNLFPKSSEFFDPKYNFPAQNKAKATQLFKKLQSEGKPLHFTCTGLSPYDGICSYVQSALAKYPGVKIGVQMVNLDQYQEGQINGTFEMTENGSVYVNPIPELLAQFSGPENYGKWNDPAVTAAGQKLLATTSLPVEKKQWGIIEQEFLKQIPFYASQASILGLVYNDKHVGGVLPVEFGTSPLFGQLYLK